MYFSLISINLHIYLDLLPFPQQNKSTHLRIREAPVLSDILCISFILLEALQGY